MQEEVSLLEVELGKFKHHDHYRLVGFWEIPDYHFGNGQYQGSSPQEFIASIERRNSVRPKKILLKSVSPDRLKYCVGLEEVSETEFEAVKLLIDNYNKRKSWKIIINDGKTIKPNLTEQSSNSA